MPVNPAFFGDAEKLAELERRWTQIEDGQKTVPHAEVIKWLRTWGTPKFRPWDRSRD